MTLIQFLGCVAALQILAMLRLIQLDALVWDKMRHFVVYVMAFAAGTYANMQVLAVTNVETVIVARSTLPIAVAFLDYHLRGYSLPRGSAWISFALIVGGAIGYAWEDMNLPLSAHAWILLWWSLLIFQLSYGNALIRSVPFDSLWSPVLYNNLLSIPFAFAIAVLSGERAELRQITPRGYFWLTLSCVFGTLISFSGFWCQRVVSATCYTVLGVSNKVFVVLINQLMWKHHASPRGTLMLGICLVGGAFYRPSPLRRSTVSGSELMEENKESESLQGSRDKTETEESLQR